MSQVFDSECPLQKLSDLRNYGYAKCCIDCSISVLLTSKLSPWPGRSTLSVLNINNLLQHHNNHLPQPHQLVVCSFVSANPRRVTAIGQSLLQHAAPLAYTTRIARQQIGYLTSVNLRRGRPCRCNHRSDGPSDQLNHFYQLYRCGLWIVILSVRPSVTRVLCAEAKEYTTDILIPYERVITLVFWHQQRLMGDVPFHLKFELKVTHPLEKRRLRPISAYNISTVRAMQKRSIIANRKFTCLLYTSPSPRD